MSNTDTLDDLLAELQSYDVSAPLPDYHESSRRRLERASSEQPVYGTLNTSTLDRSQRPMSLIINSRNAHPLTSDPAIRSPHGLNNSGPLSPGYSPMSPGYSPGYGPLLSPIIPVQEHHIGLNSPEIIGSRKKTLFRGFPEIIK